MRILAHYALDEAARARLERISTAVIDCFSAGGYGRVALPLLQPADLYLDMAGEDIRERMFVFEDPAGAELCLRADLTIPVCRSVLDAGAAALPARVSCLGPIFRFEASNETEPTELLQAGIECLGVPDSLAAEAEVLGLARAALEAAGAGPVIVELGDLALFSALVADLKLDDIWTRRLAYAFRHPSLLRPMLDEMRAGKRAQAKSFEIDLATASKAAAERFVRDKLGMSANDTGRRTIGEIAAHLVDKARAAQAPLPDGAQLDVIEQFIAITGVADDCLVKLKRLGSGAAFSRGLTRFGQCLQRARGQLRAGDTLRLSTTLGRDFVYYTGFVFNLNAEGLSDPLAAGGRYDRLMSDLGSARPVPAVGAAVWPERLLAMEALRG